MVKPTLLTQRQLRFSFGMAMSIALALGLDWELSFLTPVLTVSLLANPGPPPTFKAGLALVLGIGLTFAVGLLFSSVTVRYPLLGALLLGLALFRLFYWNNSGQASPFLVVLLLIAMTLLPLMSQTSQVLAIALTEGFLISGTVAVLTTWLAFGLIPDPEDAVYVAKDNNLLAMSESARLVSALASTIVVLPLALLFMAMNWVSYALVLVFVAILAQQPDIATGVKSGLALVIGNTLGGVLAIAIYGLLIAWPEYLFFVLLMLLASLLFSAKIFSEDKYAKLYSMAYSTIVLLICSVTSSSGGEVDDKFLARILQLLMVTIYLTLSLTAVNSAIARRTARRELSLA
jgi:uncharacterized membrane protein YccC